MKKLIISVITIFPLMVSANAYALPSQTDVLIVELQVRSSAATGAADQEFVELYNSTTKPIDVSTWKLQYKSTTGSSWTDKVTLHGILDAHSHYLLVSDKYSNPPANTAGKPALALDIFNAGLSDSGGHVRIADMVVPALPVVHDLLGWGASANTAEGNAPAAAPAGGKSLKRRVSDDGNFQDSDNNANDFEVSSSPSPQADPLFIAQISEPAPDPIIVPEPTTTPEPDPAPTTGTEPPASNPAEPSSTDQPLPPAEDVPTTPPIAMVAPQITELLPNPAAPASDSTDEFIEVYNPNDQPLDLKGYKLQSGNSFSYSYTFDSMTLAAHEYRAFLVTQTNDILSNTSGQARLMDAAGTVVAQTNGYDSAPEGQAWAFINGAWQWTTTPTPNQPNILATVVPKTVGIIKASTAKPTTSTKTTPKSTTAAKPKATTTKAAKTTAAPDRQVYQDPAATPPAIHPGILAGVGVITLLYGCYEYRYDAANLFRRFQRYRGLRRAARTAASGR